MQNIVDNDSFASMVLNIRVLIILWLIVSVYSICLKYPKKPKCTWSICTITCSAGCGENLKDSVDEALQNKPIDCQPSEFKLVTKDVLFEADIKNSLFSKDAEFYEMHLHIQTITRINMIENAFLSNQFRQLTSLSLEIETMVTGANTIHFNRDSLNGLTSLVTLTISGEKIQISSGILFGVSSTLSYFTLSFPSDSIDLKLLTEEVHLPALVAITIRTNLKDSRITSDLFIGVPNLRKLDLSDCKIDMIYANAFEPIANSLEMLNLEKNNLKSVAAGLFDDLRELIVLKVNNNPWICSTELCEFQRYLIKHLEFAAEVECQTPVSGIPVVLVKDLCSSEDSELALQCLKDESTIYIAAQNTSMTILNGDNQDVTIQFDEIPHINLSLMWFSNKFINTTRITDMKVNVGNLNLSTAYIFCLIDITLTRVSPLNCLSHYLVSSSINPQLPWLTSDDKRDVFSCFFGGIILCLILGFIAGYLVIARNPMLLKGSRKIIVIRNCNRTSDASTTPFESISDWNRLSELGLHYRRSTIENDSSNCQYYMTANFPSRFDIIKSALDKSQSISTVENDYTIVICPNSNPPPLPDAMTYNRNKEEPIYATISPFHGNFIK